MVRWAQTSARPGAAMLSLPGLNLASVLGNPNVFAGFTSGTGSGFGEHDILSWNFVDQFSAGGAPLPAEVSAVPEPSAWALLGTGLLAAAARRRRAPGA